MTPTVGSFTFRAVCVRFLIHGCNGISSPKFQGMKENISYVLETRGASLHTYIDLLNKNFEATPLFTFTPDPIKDGTNDQLTLESFDEGCSLSVLRANKIPSEVVVLVTVLR
ncbi:hypothetical protein BDC45DRAFT_535593 [Circinella umbellata]|nr:hypothetical protein BDC45DRAFT_535593 [Circinella umbellata]